MTGTRLDLRERVLGANRGEWVIDGGSGLDSAGSLLLVQGLKLGRRNHGGRGQWQKDKGEAKM